MHFGVFFVGAIFHLCILVLVLLDSVVLDDFVKPQLKAFWGLLCIFPGFLSISMYFSVATGHFHIFGKRSQPTTLCTVFYMFLHWFALSRGFCCTGQPPKERGRNRFFGFGNVIHYESLPFLRSVQDCPSLRWSIFWILGFKPQLQDGGLPCFWVIS